MKPRNNFEKTVVSLHDQLPPLGKRQIKWAFRECINHYAFRLPKGKTTCMDCGHTWVMPRDKETCVCPHCHAKLTVKATTQRVMRGRGYFTILTTCGAYQVLRMFLLDVSFEKGCKPSIQTYEIGAYWWNDDGQKCVMAVRKCMGYYIDTFSFASPIAVRNDNNAYQYVAGSYLYPKHQVIDIVRRNGFDGNLHGIPTHDFISAILTDNRYETMLKVGLSRKKVGIKHTVLIF